MSTFEPGQSEDALRDLRAVSEERGDNGELGNDPAKCSGDSLPVSHGQIR